MDRGRIVFAILGFSASFLLCLPNLWKWQAKKLAEEKLRIVNEALKQAEERMIRHEERHDRLLSQICSNYFISQYMDEALASARGAMNDAREFAAILRNLQMEILSSFPGEDVSSIPPFFG
ncbi:OLC1v1000388C1 [Oldenlandia corymbosa var. corymbosa]|uniref:OLC1v1000388C1 n=1 Tax=Oldenlandia corymbosa var. corymbosa TaxID=529605 RepID=A0AAV1D3Q4_OLDCO|nr:OLC1v1000388C1 [Oldenlandia corymbosa var. corymbosa]